MKKLSDYLDPSLWLLIILLLALVYLLLERRDQLNAYQQANIEASTRLAELSKASLSKERALRDQLDQLATQYRKEQQDEQAKNNATLTALRTGTQRMSVPVRACGSATTSPDPATAGRTTTQRAELAPETAAALASIAADGDAAITDLNTCIRAYKLVRDQVNVQTQ